MSRRRGSPARQACFSESQEHVAGYDYGVHDAGRGIAVGPKLRDVGCSSCLGGSKRWLAEAADRTQACDALYAS